ncbi:MAG TPA: 50S ribosomal protein L9 [Gammaproteobacteria bacterium]|nr:50S ribosomal protein L9 [Gammaproteobacteria bacterium]
MDVILLEKISNLGELGDLVSVKPGYARNFLVPQSKAVWATAGAKTRVDERRRELAQLDAERLEVAQAKSDLLPAELTLQRKAGEEGRLFGSVAAPDVVDSLAEMGITVQRSEVSMPNGPIKEIGEHTIEVILHSEVRKTLDIKVEWEQE